MRKGASALRVEVAMQFQRRRGKVGVRYIYA